MSVRLRSQPGPEMCEAADYSVRPRLTGLRWAGCPLLGVKGSGYAFGIPMRFSRFLSAALALLMALSWASVDVMPALAQTTAAESDASTAKERADTASGLVDEAVADRDRIEAQLVDSIAKANELAASLSIVGTALDRTVEQIAFADVELAGIKDQIEIQAVDAYMTLLASPTVSVVRSETVEQVLVATAVVEDVVAAGRETVDQLAMKRRSLEELQALFLMEQDEFVELQAQMQDEVDHLASLYDEADQTVATAVRQAQQADLEYRAALSALDLARARAAERARQEERTSPSTTSTTSTTSTQPTTTNPPTTTTTRPSNTTSPTTSLPSPTTTSPPTTTTTTAASGGGGPWDHPPEVERWRSLVQQFFPANRVEEALRIIDCESNGDPDAYNPYSGASGLFQFLPSTWATTAPKAGYGGASIFDPEANTASAAWLANRYEELGQYYWQAWSCRRVLG